MRFSAFAGTTIVPTLARVVLCAAFLPAGYHKVFHEHVFKGDDAQLLKELGVGTTITTASIDPASQFTIANASFRGWEFQDEDLPASTEKLQETADDVTKQTNDAIDEVLSNKDQASPPDRSPSEVIKDLLTPTEKAGPEAAPPGAPNAEPLIEVPPTPVTPDGVDDGLQVRAQALHGVTCMLVNGLEPGKAGPWKKDWKPHYMGWIAGLTELVGGALILVGLFSRIWGLGLAITMGVAFYLTSWAFLFEPGLFSLAAGTEGYGDFNRVFCQLGLGLAALGVFLTGPGGLSLDRALFGGGKNRDLDDFEPGS